MESPEPTPRRGRRRWGKGKSSKDENKQSGGVEDDGNGSIISIDEMPMDDVSVLKDDLSTDGPRPTSGLRRRIPAVFRGKGGGSKAGADDHGVDPSE